VLAPEESDQPPPLRRHVAVVFSQGIRSLHELLVPGRWLDVVLHDLDEGVSLCRGEVVVRGREGGLCVGHRGGVGSHEEELTPSSRHDHLTSTQAHALIEIMQHNVQPTTRHKELKGARTTSNISHT